MLMKIRYASGAWLIWAKDLTRQFQVPEVLRRFQSISNMHMLIYLDSSTLVPVARYNTAISLKVSSAPGEYPVERTSSASSAVLPSVPDDSCTRSPAILIVEDDVGVLGLMAAILAPLGYRVLTAQNGNEALRLCQAHRIRVDLLITDVVMPGMSGHELAEAFKAIQPAMQVL